MTTPDYTLLDHTADLGIKIKGTDQKDLFKSAGKALMHLLVKINPSEKQTPMKISVSGDDLEDLMVRWLGEILYLFEGENLVVTSIEIESLSPSRLEAGIETAPFNPRIHELLREIKAVTYHQIKVAERDGIWEARVIFDL
ncbi:MAG: archease [Deltaproteobacteria bacterium]|nr:archease [Deltaproteobacteria bacterium]